jgi:hypothetical protein
MLDGKEHTVYAYGIDTQSGPSSELTNSPKKFTCANAKAPIGVKRHVVDPASMKAWSFSSLTDVAPEPDAIVNAYPQSADWAEKPELVQADDGTPEVWLIDGEVRRHVINPASLAAWHFTGTDAVKTPAAKVYGYAKGLDLPAEPFLVIGSGPAVWVIDTAPGGPGPNGNDAGADGGNGNGNGDNGDNGGGGGCSMQPSPLARSPGWLLAFAATIVLARRRRR